MNSVTVQRTETMVSESNELHVDVPDADAPMECPSITPSLSVYIRAPVHRFGFSVRQEGLYAPAFQTTWVPFSPSLPSTTYDPSELASYLIPFSTVEELHKRFIRRCEAHATLYTKPSPYSRGTIATFG